MNNILQPATWLIILIVGLPQLSETIYTPSLPTIAEDLKASESMVEHTLTIFLFSFAIGTLFWGRISDYLGRKPCVIAGLLIFTLGSICCYFSPTVELLLVSRFIQAFGGSIGSVLGQAITRDSFEGADLGRLYSSITIALVVFPAVGPIIGGALAEFFGWSANFLFLIVFALILTVIIARLLPETHPVAGRKHFSLLKITLTLLQDKKVLGFAVIIGGCNGMGFSYFAESSFDLIHILEMSPTAYGFTYVAISASMLLGGFTSKKLQDTLKAIDIMGRGIKIILISCLVFSVLMLLGTTVIKTPNFILASIIVISQMAIMYGSRMVIANSLALALVDYKWCTGTASSIFGFIYYCIISLVTFGMGLLHNGTLLPMPLYFLVIAGLMAIVSGNLVRKLKTL